MVNNSININEKNNHLSSQIIEHSLFMEIQVLAWDMHKNVFLYNILPNSGI
jgi:hypothetical protein